MVRIYDGKGGWRRHDEGGLTFVACNLTSTSPWHDASASLRDVVNKPKERTSGPQFPFEIHYHIPIGARKLIRTPLSPTISSMISLLSVIS